MAPLPLIVMPVSLVHRFSVYIEAVASDMFGAGASGMINPPDPSRYYSISVAELAVFDGDVHDLLMDLTIIYDMAEVRRHCRVWWSLQTGAHSLKYNIIYMEPRVG